MKIFTPLVAFVSLALSCCEDKSKRAHADSREPSQGMIVKLERSSPASLDTFHENLDKALATWREVEHKDFHYESPEFAHTFLPWQEGRIQDPKSGKSGNWRYYHCAGLRIQWDGEPVKYYLPPPYVEVTGKKPEAEPQR